MLFKSLNQINDEFMNNSTGDFPVAHNDMLVLVEFKVGLFTNHLGYVMRL